MKRKPESWPTRPRITIELVLRRAHRLEPFRQRKRVATITPRRYAVATRGRVPRRLSPLNRRLVRHATNVGPGYDSQEFGFGGFSAAGSVIASSTFPTSAPGCQVGGRTDLGGNGKSLNAMVRRRNGQSLHRVTRNCLMAPISGSWPRPPRRWVWTASWRSRARPRSSSQRGAAMT